MIVLYKLMVSGQTMLIQLSYFRIPFSRLLFACLLLQPVIAPAANTEADPGWLRQVLEQYSESYNMPAIGVSVVIGGEVVAASVIGRRKSDENIPAQQNDRFHIGSIAKPMTVTMLARLVELGFFNWNDTIEKMFPGLVDIMQPTYRKVTIEQLISHTSGMPYSPVTPETETDKYGSTLESKRKGYVIAALKDPPLANPGTKYIYGGGHIIAAHYAEILMGITYEDLMKQEVFDPLGMQSARFGTTATPGKVDAPWEHIMENGMLKPVPPDNRQYHQARSPVGRNLCMSVSDLGRFAAIHLVGANKSNRFLKKETFTYLHGPVTEVAAGPSWSIGKVDWAKGRILWHGGSNLRNLAKCHIVPDENFAVCLATNVWYEGIDEPFDRLNLEIVQMIQAGKFNSLLTSRSNEPD